MRKICVIMGGQRLLQQRGRDFDVGCHKQQHRCHIGVDHTGPLGDGADMAGRAVYLKRQRVFLGVGVGGHNGGGGGMAAGGIGA